MRTQEYMSTEPTDGSQAVNAAQEAESGGYCCSTLGQDNRADCKLGPEYRAHEFLPTEMCFLSIQVHYGRFSFSSAILGANTV